AGRAQYAGRAVREHCARRVDDPASLSVRATDFRESARGPRGRSADRLLPIHDPLVIARTEGRADHLPAGPGDIGDAASESEIERRLFSLAGRLDARLVEPAVLYLLHGGSLRRRRVPVRAALGDCTDS